MTKPLITADLAYFSTKKYIVVDPRGLMSYVGSTTNVKSKKPRERTRPEALHI